MGMHLYEKSITENGKVTLSLVKSIRLSGAQGIVATFISSEPNKDLENWSLTPEAIAELIGESKENKVILFTSQYEASGEPSVSILKTLTGKSNIVDTEVLFMLQPIASPVFAEGPSNAPLKIEYSADQKPENVFESVLVKGGVSKLNHSWKLAPPKMQIGGVIR